MHEKIEDPHVRRKVKALERLFIFSPLGTNHKQKFVELHNRSIDLQNEYEAFWNRAEKDFDAFLAQQLEE